MTEEQALKILRYPSRSYVDVVKSLANLTWQEETALVLCGQRNMTQERAAEEQGCSVNTMQRWYRAGISKIVATCEEHKWVAKVIS